MNMEEKVLKALARCPLFGGMGALEIEMSMSGCNYRLVRFDHHDIYALAGMPCKTADIVVSGTLVCRMSSLSGKQVEVSRLQAGEIVAPAFIFGNDSELPVSVETEEETVVLRMQKPEFRTLIGSDERILTNFIRVLSNIDIFLTRRIKVLSLFTVREKVAWMLLEQAGEQGTNTIHLTRSRQEIADSFGIQKFSLLRVLSDFQKEGAIRVAGREITILNRSKMK
ncbi:Crp/Fnr family transcriptional regulator [[Hallella] seregens]|uniref:Crp/Fnr family transcriptional regulator n=1 Tax=Hallella seregens ATCC 51272 TaxID=1336250 RepID=A0ABV5ZNX1_9BACT|nr:Crp/Fnr family transcriptional regulator [Hallella seregens]